MRLVAAESNNLALRLELDIFENMSVAEFARWKIKGFFYSLR